MYGGFGGCMGGYVLGTSQPSFEPKSKARTILMALYLSGLIAIPLEKSPF